jgi:integrase
VYRCYFEKADFASLPADCVTRIHLLQFRASTIKTPSQCAKGIGLVSQAYTWAKNEIMPGATSVLYDGINPAEGIESPAMLSRERILTHAEISRLLTGIESLPLKYRTFFLCRLIVPCRITELCNMRREDVDLANGKWIKRVTKNGRPQQTHIPSQAAWLLRAMPNEGKYFFMGYGDRPIQTKSVRKQWNAFRQALDCQDVQLLDFRRTLSSYLYSQVKADDLTAKAILNHYDGRPVAIYTRLNYEYLAGIVQAYADWICGTKEDSHAYQSHLPFAYSVIHRMRPAQPGYGNGECS